MAQISKGARFRHIWLALSRKYGKPTARRDLPPTEQLVVSALRPVRGKIKEHQALKVLTEHFVAWNEARVAMQTELSGLLKPCGVSPADATTLKRLLEEIFTRHNHVTLDFLQGVAWDEAKKALSRFESMRGDILADLLMGPLEHSHPLVEAEVLRVFIRVGICPPKTRPEQAEHTLGRIIGSRPPYAVHRLLWWHAQETCTAEDPNCTKCLLLKHCQYGVARVAAEEKERKRAAAAKKKADATAKRQAAKKAKAKAAKASRKRSSASASTAKKKKAKKAAK